MPGGIPHKEAMRLARDDAERKRKDYSITVVEEPEENYTDDDMKVWRCWRLTTSDGDELFMVTHVDPDTGEGSWEWKDKTPLDKCLRREWRTVLQRKAERHFKKLRKLHGGTVQYTPPD